MKDALAYSNDSDQEVYRDVNVPVGSLSVSIIAATVAGSQSKPNEDAFAINAVNEAIIGAVFDGTTSLKPIAALKGASGARYASHFLKDNFAHVSTITQIQNIILQLNEKLLQASIELGGKLDDTHSLPASLATIVKIADSGDSCTFTHTGDSFGITYFSDGHSEVFTDDTNKEFDDKMFALLDEVSKSKGVTPRVARGDERIHTALVDMFIARNNSPDGKGSGLVNGDPNLARYIQSGEIALDGVTSILIATDGLLPPGWSLENEQDRQKMLAAIQEGGFKKLFSIKKKAEDDDPDWNHLRYKHSDDATGVLFGFEA